MSLDQYAVFGHPIRHSKSPQIHTRFAEKTGQLLEYSAQDVPAENFTDMVNAFFANGGKGLNCTVPLKELAWRRADRLTDRAQHSKAVNTLVLQADGSLLGDNTDGIGLVTDLTRNNGIQLTDKRILILGAGGASRGIVGPIQQQQPRSIVIANRTVDKAHQLAAEFARQGKIAGCGIDQLQQQTFDLIINATSASLSNELPPLSGQLLTKGGYCYDLAYAENATPFVRWGQSQHAARSLDGLGMLVEQAAEAFFLWRRVRPETASVIEALRRHSL